MSFLGTGFGGASGSYSITNSARFNGTSGYLSRTLTTSATTSGSVWVKRSKLGSVSPIFDNKVYFTSGDALYAFGLTSTALYRDPSAWMHIFWNGTGVYVNGTLVTGTGTYTAASVTNPRLGYDGTNYFSGYLSDFAFWNGSSASLQGGGTDANGVWAARRPSAGYSFLAFGSSGALGTDTSGNGNTWTVSGSPAQTTDTPTNNYATFNPLDVYSTLAVTLSNGNLTQSSYVNGGYMIATVPVPPSGKWYWEITMDNIATSPAVGVATSAGAASTNVAANSVYYYKGTGNIWIDGSSPGSAYGGTWTTGQTIAVAFDAGNNKLFFGLIPNGGGAITWQNSGDPVAGTNPVPGTSLSGKTWFPCVVQSGSGTTQISGNFGQTTWKGNNVPTGFKALCTANLTSTAVTTSGTFTGNANADGPFIWTNGNPATLTINGNAVTFGTHADKTAGGFKLRSSSASYNTGGSNTWTATAGKRFVYSATSINTAQGNP